MSSQQSSPRSIASFIKMSDAALKAAGIASYHLDTELLLANTLNLKREWLLAHSGADIAEPEWNKLCQLLYLRSQRCPLAYLPGHKEFYGRDFIVTPDVLIPRPESEQIIEYVKEICASHSVASLADIGTGSGCLAITAKLECPELQVIAADISPAALAIAEQNANRLLSSSTESETTADKIDFVQSDLCSNLSDKFDIIIANLPYVRYDDEFVSPEINFEPSLALFDKDKDGLGLIRKLLHQAPEHLNNNSYLILEMEPDQIKKLLEDLPNNFKVMKREPFTLVLQFQTI